MTRISDNPDWVYAFAMIVILIGLVLVGAFILNLAVTGETSISFAPDSNYTKNIKEIENPLVYDASEDMSSRRRRIEKEFLEIFTFRWLSSMLIFLGALYLMGKFYTKNPSFRAAAWFFALFVFIKF
jgi:hypothetical protein